MNGRLQYVLTTFFIQDLDLEEGPEGGNNAVEVESEAEEIEGIGENEYRDSDNNDNGKVHLGSFLQHYFGSNTNYLRF